jgi:hypothetical protein
MGFCADERRGFSLDARLQQHLQRGAYSAGVIGVLAGLRRVDWSRAIAYSVLPVAASQGRSELERPSSLPGATIRTKIRKPIVTSRGTEI